MWKSALEVDIRHCYFYTILTNDNSASQFSQSDSLAEGGLFFPKHHYSEPIQHSSESRLLYSEKFSHSRGVDADYGSSVTGCWNRDPGRVWSVRYVNLIKVSSGGNSVTVGQEEGRVVAQYSQQLSHVTAGISTVTDIRCRNLIYL